MEKFTNNKFGNFVIFLLILINLPLLCRNSLTSTTKSKLDFIEAIQTGDLDKVKKLINHNNIVIDLKDNNGMTPLMLATIEKNLNIVKELINAGANVDTQNNTGNTALILAAKVGDRQIVQELINAGADIDIQNNNFGTAISLAKSKIIKLFLHRINEIDKNINQKLHNLPPTSKIVFAKRIINQQKTNLYNLVVEILNNLNPSQIKDIFNKREINNLINSYKNKEIYNLGEFNQILNFAKKYAPSNLQFLIQRLEKEQQRLAKTREKFDDIDIITQN